MGFSVFQFFTQSPYFKIRDKLSHLNIGYKIEVVSLVFICRFSEYDFINGHRKVSSRFKFRFTFDRLSLDIQDQFCPYLSFDRYSNSYLTFIRYSLYIQFTFVRHSSLVSTTICLSLGISFLNLPLLDIHYTFSSHSLDIQVWCQPLPPNSFSTTLCLS